MPVQISRAYRRLVQPVDSTVLVFFRICVGAALYVWADEYLADDKYAAIFIEPRVLFKYAGFQWVERWPGAGMYWHFVVAKVAAICLAVGVLSRLAAATLCAAVAYVLLVERQIYVNHYYLLACCAGLLVFLPAGRRGSIDAATGIERHEWTFHRWQLWLLRFQLGLPYLFGAVAKLNADWLAGQPIGLMLERRAHFEVIGPYLQLPGMVGLFAYGGLLYDLLVVPMLLYRPTRPLAVAWSVAFHLTNATLLHIGVFPWFMLATLVVFFPPDFLPSRWHRIASWYRRSVRPAESLSSDTISRDTVSRDIVSRDTVSRDIVSRDTVSRDTARVCAESQTASGGRVHAGLLLASVYVVVHMLLPLRPWLLPGNPSWNERGHRFAWRMMLRNKRTLTHFLVIDEQTGDHLFLPSSTIMTGYQVQRAERNPECIRQAAVALSELAAEFGVAENRVHALALVSLNGRRPVPMIDPKVDLTRAKRGWFADSWVTPDPGPFLEPPWRHPKNEWWKRLDLPEPFKPLEGRTPTELQQYLDRLAKEKPRSE